MLAAQLVEPGRIVMQQVSRPEAGPGEVIVEVEVALTCGTDLKTYRRGHPKFPFPYLMGHECSGIVHEVGEGVTRFAPGQAVMVAPTAPCLTCRQCQRGFFNLCSSIMARMAHGAFAQFYRVPREVVEQNLFPRPDHVSPLRAAFLEPLACVVQGQGRVPLQASDTVVVMGCGTIGLLHVMLAKRRGAGRIIVTGRHTERLELARELGATDLVDVDRQDAVEAVRELTGGFGAELVIECVGRPEAWEDASAMACQGGFVLLFGGCPAGSRASFDTGRVHYDQLTLQGAFHFTPADVRQAYDYLCQGELPVERLISGSHSLEELPTIIDRLDRGQGIKYAILPQ